MFFGKGLCVACHSGRVFSDGQYYNTGIVSEPINFNGRNLEDLGRFTVTRVDTDKYKFKLLI